MNLRKRTIAAIAAGAAAVGGLGGQQLEERLPNPQVRQLEEELAMEAAAAFDMQQEAQRLEVQLEAALEARNMWADEADMATERAMDLRTDVDLLQQDLRFWRDRARALEQQLQQEVEPDPDGGIDRDAIPAGAPGGFQRAMERAGLGAGAQRWTQRLHAQPTGGSQ